MKISDVRLIELHSSSDERGVLTVIEDRLLEAFQIKRIFYIHDVVSGAIRGGHAHLETDQLAIALYGQLKILVSDGIQSRIFILDDPRRGLILPRLTWTSLFDFSHGAVCMVLANSYYEREKSIRTWPDYLLERRLPLSIEPSSAISIESSEIGTCDGE
jgi:dTDP-4-dehydrorhamnose 3,5-epimerase-like enzyme